MQRRTTNDPFWTWRWILLHYLGLEKGRNSTAYLRCIQSHVLDMTLDTPNIGCRFPPFVQAQKGCVPQKETHYKSYLVETRRLRALFWLGRFRRGILLLEWGTTCTQTWSTWEMTLWFELHGLYDLICHLPSAAALVGKNSYKKLAKKNTLETSRVAVYMFLYCVYRGCSL